MSPLSKVYEATWGRAFAAAYDRTLAATEQAGLAARRAELIADASGDVVEIGAGTGLNLEHYGDQVDSLLLAEPEPAMASRLRRRTDAAPGQPTVPTRGPRTIEVIEAPAEALPVPDRSADTVVSTLVLCTVDDQARSLAEVARILKPGGRLLFIEHVRSSDPGLARWQDRLERPWKLIAYGCRCNRDTLAAISSSGLDVERIEHGRLPKAGPIVRPLIQGSAVLRG